MEIMIIIMLLVAPIIVAMVGARVAVEIIGAVRIAIAIIIIL